jgi:metalloprotease
MKSKIIVSAIVLSAISWQQSNAQLKINSRTLKAGENGVKAATFSDADAAALAKQSVDWMDAHNPVADEADPYTKRLNKIFGNHKNEDGLTLNYKVYKVTDINAFACADGSVRVFSALMDLMTDDELLAVIGHEIGHVKNHDTRDAIKAAYKRAAISDAAASQSGVMAKLTDGQLGQMADAILNAKFSRKQESEADLYSYAFLKKNNYNVMGEVSAFRKLAALSGGAQQSKAEKRMSSHPDSNERAATIEEMAKKDGLYKPL